jgi:hypothetical protein
MSAAVLGTPIRDPAAVRRRQAPGRGRGGPRGRPHASHPTADSGGRRAPLTRAARQHCGQRCGTLTRALSLVALPLPSAVTLRRPAPCAPCNIPGGKGGRSGGAGAGEPRERERAHDKQGVSVPGDQVRVWRPLCSLCGSGAVVLLQEPGSQQPTAKAQKAISSRREEPPIKRDNGR